ncbi:MAG: heparinase II/III family protein, partial [Acidimicrobiia bacterium]
MQRFKQITKIRKLKGRSVDELRVRLFQTLAALLERTGRSTQARVPSDRDMTSLLDPSIIGRHQAAAGPLLDHFRVRRSPAFFAGFDDRRATIAELERRWPEANARTVERAERISKGSFDLLGLHNLRFGRPIDWHLEPLAGKRAPMTHWSSIDYLDPNEAGDKKIVWELNRHQYLLTLGQAYWLTGREQYATTFVEHVTQWMDKNPPKLGINWASSLEIAFRAISWLWALYFFKHSPSLTPAVFWRLLKYLYLHGRHLETYPSTYFSPNTHLTGEALGLFYLGVLVPEFRRSGRWRTLGRHILLSALTPHVRSDGVYFEQSSYYQRYTADFYTHFYLLSRRNGETVDRTCADSLAALIDYLMHITRPDGTTPL